MSSVLVNVVTAAPVLTGGLLFAVISSCLLRQAKSRPARLL